MSDKKFTPQEVAVAVLKKSQEVLAKYKQSKSEVCKEEVEKCGPMSKEEKKEFSGAVGDVDPKIILDMKDKLRDSKDKEDKKSKKLPEFLKKKFMKKSMGAPMAPEAAKGTSSQSPQKPSIGSQIGWPNSGKSEK